MAHDLGQLDLEQGKVPADFRALEEHGESACSSGRRACESLWDRGAACAALLSSSAFWGRPDDTAKTLPPQWKLHHSRWRYVTALFPYLGPPLFTLHRVLAPVACVMAVCVAIKLAEGRVTWQLDQHNNYAVLFRYSSFVLSLLLAFRANRTYDRWWQARCAWGGIGGGIVNAVRQVATWSDDPVLIRQFQKWGLCMVYGMLQLVDNTPKVTDPRVRQLLEPEELALYESTTKPAKLCGTMLSALVEGQGWGPEREVLMNQILSSVAANCSMVARIKLQCMPYGMSLFCAGWTFIWLLLLPFGVFPEASWSALLPCFCMATMLLGLEDASNQLEDPFRFFPYEAMTATTAKDMPRTVQEVMACKAMIRARYAPQLGTLQSMAELPPFPKLPPRPQMA